MAKVTSVVHSAIQRALRRSAGPSPRNARMKSAPTSGRKVVTERTGQLMFRSSAGKHEPGDERRHAQEHGERVMIEVTGLQPDRAARDVEHARRNPVRPEAVDQPAITTLP